MKAILLFILLLFSVMATAQKGQLKGKVLDTLNRPLPSIKITNMTSGVMVLTNNQGDFVLPVAKRDSIYVTSIFFDERKYKVDKKMLEEGVLVVLKDKVNELEDVVVVDSIPYYDVDEEEYNATLKQQIENDIKNNPGDYRMAVIEGPGKINVLNLVKFMGKLFKKKRKGREEEADYTISVAHLEQLFANSSTFTKELLTNQLHIPDEYIPLFYTYCEVQYWESDLLEVKNEFQLLDVMVLAADNFLKELKANTN